MKDYSIYKEEARRFILRYEIKSDKIIAELASGEDYVIPYTKENEIKVLEKMEEQVLYADKFLKSNKQTKESYLKLGAIELLFSIMCIMMDNEIMHTGMGMFSLTSILIAARAKIKSDDYNKSKAFLDNKELFTKEYMSENVLNGLSILTKSLLEGKETLTINDIDRISCRDLRKLLSNLRREREFGFDKVKSITHSK